MIRSLWAEPAGLRRFGLFLLVGGVNTLVGYGLFVLFILLGASDVAALAGATVLGVLFNFRSIGRLVFKSDSGNRLPRFIAVYAVQFLINLGALKLLGSLGLSPILAQLLLVPPLAIATFVAMQRFVFEPDDGERSPA